MTKQIHVGVWLTFLWAASFSAHAQGTSDAFVARIPAESMASSVNLKLSNENGIAGKTVQIPISLTATATAAPSTFQLDLSFDAQKLTFSSTQPGPQLTAAGKTISASILPNGNIRISATGSGQTTIANGVAGYVSFTINPTLFTGSSTVTPLNCLSSGGQGSALSTGCTSGTVTTMLCDINGDGQVNVADVQLMINQALGTIAAVNDLNHDGTVNVADVQKEINAALGLGCAY